MGNSGLDSGLVESLACIEETIGEHYQAYAEKFPQHKDFWAFLAKAEGQHAQWIRDLSLEAKSGKVSIDEKRFNKESVKEFCRYLEVMLTAIRQKDVTIKQALSDSLKIERMVLEKDLFEVFVAHAPEPQQVIARIIEETKDHRQRIEQMLKNYPV